MPAWSGLGRAAAAGSVAGPPGALLGLAGSALFRGLSSLFGAGARRRQAQAEAENTRRVGQHRVDLGQGQLDRRSAVLGGLIRALSARPYNTNTAALDMFGDALPDRLSPESLRLAAYPTLRASAPGGMNAFLSGMLQGGDDYLNRPPVLMSGR